MGENIPIRKIYDNFPNAQNLWARQPGLLGHDANVYNSSNGYKV